jgi:integrase
MAWIVKIPPSPRHRRIRWQVRYQDGSHERSAGIYPTRREAVAAKHAIERGEPPPTAPEPGLDRTTLFGAYATQVWWPAWSPTHPRSGGSIKAKVNARILPAFGDLPLNQVDADLISRWTHALAADGLSPASIRTYQALLGLILNAAVTDGHLPHAPTLPAPPIGRPARSSAVWLSRVQLDRLADAIEPRYRALVLTAVRTGARWSELVALRWEDFRPDLPLDDGAIAGPGRLRLRRPAIAPAGRKAEPAEEEEEAHRLIIHRTIALDQQTIEVLLTHRERFDGRARARIFTNPRGRRPDQPLSTGSFARSWQPALVTAGLDQAWLDHGGLRVADLRHTHAVWLLAQHAPVPAIAKRLGHASPLVTMRMYQHAATLVEDGHLTLQQLGLLPSPSQQRHRPRR